MSKAASNLATDQIHWHVHCLESLPRASLCVSSLVQSDVLFKEYPRQELRILPSHRPMEGQWKDGE